MVLDIEVFGLEESLLHRDPPGAIVGIAVALQPDRARHLVSSRLFYVPATGAAVSWMPEYSKFQRLATGSRQT
jgi:hypothetical protein